MLPCSCQWALRVPVVGVEATAMTDPRSQAFEKQQGVPRSWTRIGGDTEAAGRDTRASLMQSWEVSGEAMGLPIDPFAPSAGDAAFAQSHAWAEAMSPIDASTASPWSVAGHVDPALAGDEAAGGWARAPAADSTAKAAAVPGTGRRAAVRHPGADH